MMIIRIRPLDTFFFRDGKPFSMGQETWADGVFPPSPSTLYGALRAIYFAHHPEEFKRVNIVDDPTRNLKINGIFLEIGEYIYLPVPADFVITKDKHNKETKRLLTVIPCNNHLSSNKTDWITTTDNDLTIKNIENNPLFDKENYQDYLNIESIDSLPYSTSKDYLENEPKIAFKKSDSSGTIEEESLHRAGTQRFKEDNGKKVSIVIDFNSNGLEIPVNDFVKLGGEGKVAYYETIDKESCTKIASFEIINGNKHFKICLATPALFKQGWLPSWINKKTLEGEFKNLKLKLLTAIVGKPILIGGFDMKNNEPKPMYKAVPAGSVYYFELINGSMKEVINTFHQKSISDLKGVEGFGITYVGKMQ